MKDDELNKLSSASDWVNVTDTSPAQKEYHKVWLSISFDSIGKFFRKITGRNINKGET